jgi:hypothetical protein
MLKLGIFTPKCALCVGVTITCAIATFATAAQSKETDSANSSSNQAASKAGKVEVSESTDKRMRTLDEVIAPSYVTISPESAKLKKEIMDDMDNKSEAEPMCYYPI